MQLTFLNCICDKDLICFFPLIQEFGAILLLGSCYWTSVCIGRYPHFIFLRLGHVNVDMFIFHSNSTEDRRDRCCIEKACRRRERLYYICISSAQVLLFNWLLFYNSILGMASIGLLPFTRNWKHPHSRKPAEPLNGIFNTTQHHAWYIRGGLAWAGTVDFWLWWLLGCKESISKCQKASAVLGDLLTFYVTLFIFYFIAPVRFFFFSTLLISTYRVLHPNLWKGKKGAVV